MMRQHGVIDLAEFPFVRNLPTQVTVANRSGIITSSNQPQIGAQSNPRRLYLFVYNPLTVLNALHQPVANQASLNFSFKGASSGLITLSAGQWWESTFCCPTDDLWVGTTVNLSPFTLYEGLLAL